MHSTYTTYYCKRNLFTLSTGGDVINQFNSECKLEPHP